MKRLNFRTPPVLAAGLVSCAVFAVPAGASAQVRDTIIPIVLPPLDVRAARSSVAPERLPFAITGAIQSPGSLTGATAADAALRGIPGVQVANRFNDAIGERITIRGMGARAQFGIRGVRVLVDGIPATMPDGQTTLTHLDAAAITSTEVLRGPAGALWGNASGGVVALRTAPLSSHFALADVSAGENGLARYAAAFAAAPSDASVVHARVTSQQYDGYRAHASSTKRLASFGGSWTGSRNALWIAAHAVDYDANNPGSLSLRQLDSARAQANPNNVRQQTGEEGWHAELGGGWRHMIRGAALETSGYILHRDLSNPIPPTIIDLTRIAGGARAVLSATLGDYLDVTTGVEGAIQSDDRVNHVNTLGTRAALTLDQAERVVYGAPFAQAVAPVFNHVDAMVALRWDSYRFRARDRLINAGNPDDSGVRGMSAPTRAVGFRASIGDASLYINHATSFQTPTTTELANQSDGAGGFNSALDPERTRSYELGGSYARGGLRVDAAAYRAFVSRALIPFEVPDAPGRQYFQNVGSVINKGAELSARVTPAATVDVSASYAYVDARFDRYVVGTADFSGNRVPGVARTTVDARADWRYFRDAAASMILRHSGRVAANDANTESSPAFTVTDAMIQLPVFRARSAVVRVTAGVSNITDVAYNTAVAINAAGSRYYEPGPGRALYVGVSAGVSGERRAGR